MGLAEKSCCLALIMDNISIRLAQTADLPAIYELVKELAVYEKAGEQVTASLEDYQRDFAAGIFEAQVAEVDNHIAGTVIYYMTYSTWKGRMLYLEDFVVQQAYRRYGIGQRLFDAFLQTAREKEARLVKWQVLDWNEPAIAFYQKNRAIIEQEWWNGKIFLE